MKPLTDFAVQTLERRMDKANKVIQKAEKVIDQFEQMEAELNITKAYASQLDRKNKLAYMRERIYVLVLIFTNICWFLYSMS